MHFSKMKKYLFWFANEHVDFRCNEILSIIKLFKIDARIAEKADSQPWWIIELKDESDAKRIASRSVSLRYILELWASADSVKALHAHLRHAAPVLTQPYSSPDVSFKIKVETFSSSQTHQEKVDKIEAFNYLPLQGPVKLKCPDLALQCIEFYGMNRNPIPAKPEMVFFGRKIAEGQRDIINILSLKKRKFIGNTSMDAQLSLLMANQAMVKPGDLVLDPFVGTGSLLVAAAHFGGYVLGTDIDYMMVHGKTRPSRKQTRDKPRVGENVKSNMEQYGLVNHYVDVVVADSSLPLWRPHLKLDAIITDPPYGMRESMERVGSQRCSGPISEEHLPSHIPCKIHYSLEQLLDDLLSFAAHHLHLGGRLVTWLPVIRSEYKESELPCHPCLELVGNSEQVLSTTSSRRLLTFQKTSVSEDITSIMNASGNTAEELKETFREKYYKKAEKFRRDKKEKAYMNPQYLEKLGAKS